jgi:hypothetical protein
VPPLGAEAVDDAFTVVVDSSATGNFLSNDSLGRPPAVLDPRLGLPGGGSAIVGGPFNVIDTVGLVVATATVSIDGTIVFTGVAEGLGGFVYRLNQGGSSGDVAIVLIEVSLPTS